MDENISEGATAPLPEPTQPPVAPVDPAAYAAAPPQAYYAPPAPAAPAPRHVPQWVMITAAVAGGVLLLAITFGAGVAVGSHAARFERGPGRMILRPPGGWNGEQGQQNGGQGNGYDGYRGHGRMPQGHPDLETTPQP